MNARDLLSFACILVNSVRFTTKVLHVVCVQCRSTAHVLVVNLEFSQ